MVNLFFYAVLAFFGLVIDVQSSEAPNSPGFDLFSSISRRPQPNLSWMFSIDPSSSSSRGDQSNFSRMVDIDPSLMNESILSNILSPYFEGTTNLNENWRGPSDRYPYGAQQITENHQRALGYFTYRARLREFLSSSLNSSQTSGYAGRNLATFFVQINNERLRDLDLSELAPDAVDRENLGSGRFAFTYVSTGGVSHSERNGWDDLKTCFENSQDNQNFIYFIYTEREPCSGGGPNCTNLIRDTIQRYRNRNETSRSMPFVYFSEGYPNWNRDAEETRQNINVSDFDLDSAVEFIQWYRDMGTHTIKEKDNAMIKILWDAIQKEKKHRESSHDHDEL